MIEDGRNGVLVPPEDTGALATALDGLMNDPELRDRVARRAPDIADRFGVVPVAAAWGRLIDNILECDNEHHG
jgi:glycosyltransferase involved in cell wall biosynthesis